ncbi:MAG: hypothetical protein ACO3A2_07765 [Bdellovibrionia bacterium]
MKAWTVSFALWSWSLWSVNAWGAGCSYEIQGYVHSKLMTMKGDRLDDRTLNQVIQNFYLKGPPSQSRKITQITVNYCPEVTQLPMEALSLAQDHLQSMKISGTRISTLPDDLQRFQKLSFLDFSNNRLKDFPREICFLESLTALDITQNHHRFSKELIEECDRNLLTFRYAMGNGKPTDSSACLPSGEESRGFLSLRQLSQMFARVGKKISGGQDSEEKSLEEKSNEAYRRLSYPRRWIGRMLNGKTIPERSALNLQRLRSELGPLSEDEKNLYALVKSLPFTLKHATDSLKTILNQGKGVLLSNDELYRRGLKFTDNSASEEDLGNRDFVFFRFDSNEKRIETRYGDQLIVLRPDLLYQKGWVYFHDLIDQETGELQKPLEVDGKIRRVVETGFLPRFGSSEREFLGSEAALTVTYFDEKGDKKSEPYSYRLSDKFFYAGDIQEGIALSIVLETRKIGSDYQKKILGGENPRETLSGLLPKLYRIQGLIPNQVDLKKEKPIKIYDRQD